MTKAPMVILVVCSLGLTIPVRCPKSDIVVFESGSLPTQYKRPNSDVDPVAQNLQDA